jgi:hypothetical protein
LSVISNRYEQLHDACSGDDNCAPENVYESINDVRQPSLKQGKQRGKSSMVKQMSQLKDDDYLTPFSKNPVNNQEIEVCQSSTSNVNETDAPPPLSPRNRMSRDLDPLLSPSRSPDTYDYTHADVPKKDESNDSRNLLLLPTRSDGVRRLSDSSALPLEWDNLMINPEPINQLPLDIPDATTTTPPIEVIVLSYIF